MGDTRIVRAKLNAVVRRADGGPRIMVKKGVTTAHAGSDLARSHPHLWEPLDVDYPVEGADLTDAAVEAAGTSHTEALRAIAEGMAERGYDLVAQSRDEVPAQLVALVFSAIDHPRGGGVTALGEGEPGQIVTSGAGREYLVGVNDGGWKTYTPVDGGEPEQVEPAGPDVDVSTPAPGEPGTHELDEDEPDDVVDPSTPEGRKAIRAWARDHDLDVAASGPIPQDVVDAWARAQGGRG